MNQAAGALVAALQVQAGIGQRVRAWQLPLESPCAGWSVRDVMSHSIRSTVLTSM